MSVLETRGLTIRFGGHVAVNAVSCAFQPGTLTAIVGPNGAGKTTYFNLMSGQLKATAGQVLWDNEDITGLPASARARRGIGRAFQLTNLFPGLSVHENVRIAVQSRAGVGLDLWRLWNSHRDLIAETDDLLRQVNLTAQSGTTAGSLSHGDQRKLEVAIMLALRPKIFMFDEPTAGMSVDEVPVILDLIREIKAGARPHHPAGRAQDGRGALAGRPHHRAAQRHARRRRRARRGDRVADRAGSLSGGRACVIRSSH